MSYDSYGLWIQVTRYRCAHAISVMGPTEPIEYISTSKISPVACVTGNARESLSRTSQRARRYSRNVVGRERMLIPNALAVALAITRRTKSAPSSEPS